MNATFTLRLLGALCTIAWSLLSTAGAHTHDPNHTHDHDVGQAYYLAEHGDFGIGFEEGSFHLHVHLHTGAIVDGNALAEDAAFDPDGLIVVATHEARVLRPAGPMWDATGADVNEPLWILPQHEKEGLPAFGLATEEIEAGVFIDNLVTLNLRHLKGPGDLSLWIDDALGRPTFLFSTHDQSLRTALPVGLHAHCNWGFTQAGTYTAVFEATGTRPEGGDTSALAILTFLVTEAPIPLETLDGDVNADGVVDQTDLRIVEDNLGRTTRVWPVPNEE